MNIYLLVIVSIIYCFVAIDYFIDNRVAMGIVFVAYSIANLALYYSGEWIMKNGTYTVDELLDILNNYKKDYGGNRAVYFYNEKSDRLRTNKLPIKDYDTYQDFVTHNDVLNLYSYEDK